MATRIRLKRMGKRSNPFFRIVVTERREKRDGKVLATLGFYNPKTAPPTIKVDKKLLESWQKNGAQPSDPVRKLLNL